ncbi:MAG TPA: hypothetical protein VHB21_05185, partial [Minicystis sp.]|nr:hypothetical protein [Minicystis sp.]
MQPNSVANDRGGRYVAISSFDLTTNLSMALHVASPPRDALRKALVERRGCHESESLSGARDVESAARLAVRAA